MNRAERLKSLPGVEVATITSSDLAAGDRLTLEPPSDGEVGWPG